MCARPFIDSLDFARNGRKIDGTVQVAELPRMHDLLVDTQGQLDYEVSGDKDQQGNPLLHLAVTGSCHLRCQRCMEGMDYPVSIETRLLLRNQASLDELDDAEDEYDSILAEAQLDVLNLLEEEILLSLPISPRHEPGACQAAGSGKETGASPVNGGPEQPQREGQHPFAVLAKLKRD